MKAKNPFKAQNDKILLREIAELCPGWTVLQYGTVVHGGDGQEVQLEYVLLHPVLGIAVLDILPCCPSPGNIADTLRSELARDVRISKREPLPPVVRIGLHHKELHSLRYSLEEAFGRAPASPGEQDESLVDAVQDLLGASRLYPPENKVAVPTYIPSASREFPRLAWRRPAERGAATRFVYLSGVVAVVLSVGGVGHYIYTDWSYVLRPSHLLPTANLEQTLLVPPAGWSSVGIEADTRPPVGELASHPHVASAISAPQRIRMQPTELPDVPPVAEPQDLDDAGPALVSGAEAAMAAPGEMPAAFSISTPGPAEAAAPQSAAAVALATQALPNVAMGAESSSPDAAIAEPTPPESVPAAADAPEVHTAERPSAEVTGAAAPESLATTMRLQEDMPSRAQGEEMSNPDAPARTKVDAPLAASTEAHPPSSPPVQEVELRIPEPRLATAPSGPKASAGGEARIAAPLQLPAASIDALIRRADSMSALGDISAARLLYSRAAMAGSGQAALALGRTYDPLFLADIGVRGMPGDAAAAIEWYRRALALGVAGARERLALHGVRPGE